MTSAVAGAMARTWATRSACAGMDTDLFFPLTENGPRAHELIEQAKVICRRCPVIRECLDAALDLADTDGIWGGLTNAERRRLSRSR